MRWEALFADMEAQLVAGRVADVRADVAELARAERASVTLASRARASVGRQVRILLGGTDVIEGELVDAAPQWLLVATSPARRALVPTGSAIAVAGLEDHAAPGPGPVERGLGLGHALRALARDRVVVRVRTGDTDLTGRIERVGADHLDLTDLGGTGRGAWAVAFAGLRAVQTG
ncbi:hypothetical protein [Cellulomonas fengjieae]|uniref:Fis family transcriptional regulator n=1 Tax=Cellulomonas fengjieae TaxID=2819978 RepID=A0ABS3SEI2_9CELL|nr:hypothetical protein [Cellulomonas fengjieae]MBO3083894.1 hypothetical protein [Cellulomonas fengjieae]QVI64823.1 hypothetical protein KG102_11720 [Cellulomonas fengjieae]